MINNEIKINGRRLCCMRPDKIIPPITTLTMRKTTEIMLKAMDNVATEKTLCPFHPGVAKPTIHKSVATLIIARIKMSIIRSLTGRILARTV